MAGIASNHESQQATNGTFNLNVRPILLSMPANFSQVFSTLRDILSRHAGKLVVAEDTPDCYRLEGGRHPTHKKPFPVAWVTVGKAYVSFHHMGIYARSDLLKGVSKELKARMQGKSCLNFTTVVRRYLRSLRISRFAASGHSEMHRS